GSLARAAAEESFRLLERGEVDQFFGPGTDPGPRRLHDRMRHAVDRHDGSGGESIDAAQSTRRDEDLPTRVPREIDEAGEQRIVAEGTGGGNGETSRMPQRGLGPDGHGGSPRRFDDHVEVEARELVRSGNQS